MVEDLFEGSSEFDVEDRIDDRIEEAVHVSEPDKEREEYWIDFTDRLIGEEIVADADGVCNVDSEERNPAKKKNT